MKIIFGILFLVPSLIPTNESSKITDDKSTTFGSLLLERSKPDSSTNNDYNTSQSYKYQFIRTKRMASEVGKKPRIESTLSGGSKFSHVEIPNSKDFISRMKGLSISSGKSCIVTYSNEKQPLYFQEDSLLISNTVTLDSGSKITADCGKINDNTNNIDGKTYGHIEMTCDGDKIFKSASMTNINIDEVLCTNKVQSTEWEETPSTCKNGLRMINVGFKTTSKSVVVYTVCMDSMTSSRKYVVHKYPPVKDNFRGAISSDTFKESKVFRGMGMNQKYVGNHNFDRGHLLPHADFIWPVHREATNRFVNVAPQWDSFNRQNWRYLEDYIRRLLDEKRDINLITGVFGNLTSGKVTKTLNGDLQIPKWFYKVLSKPATSECLVFLGLNDQSIKSLNRFNSVLENDFANCYKHSKPNSFESTYCLGIHSNADSGYVTCCEYTSVANVITDIPDFPCTNILRMGHL